jgi:Ca-activated chloride channel family protein
VVFGKWKGAAQGKITLTGTSGRGRFVNTIDVGTVAPDARHGALSYLWARARISNLSDFYAQDAHRQDIIDLGLRYNLLTRFTSFIAVQQQVRTTGPSIDVDQPLPLPVGVSEAAVGMEQGPEPALMILLAMIAMAVGWQSWRRYRHARAARLA